MTALARKLESLREKGDMRDNEVANLLGTRPETVSRWNQGKAYPHARTEQKLLELEYIVDQLNDLYSPREARQFIFSRQRLLNDKSPAELIRDGHFEAVITLIGRMRDGIYS
ncbi:hypothetical protein ACLBKT_03990 [Erythrobacter sp. W302b]|uniref:hypothetical protein n=1 Tax=Erythrobacter sp. W302b TaxID=3389874 RepID=UPI00396B30D1